jgi:hypothetical protein
MVADRMQRRATRGMGDGMLKTILAAGAASLWLLAAAGTGLAADPSAPAAADNPAGPAPDSREGYYYPKPQTTETYRSTAEIMSDTSRVRRLAFVTGMTEKMFKDPFPPPYAIFAKGDDAERLIIVGMEDGRFNTLYRARALFAMLTAIARLTPVFRDAKVDELSNFLDLCKMLGFTSLIWSDGRSRAHAIFIQ